MLIISSADPGSDPSLTPLSAGDPDVTQGSMGSSPGGRGGGENVAVVYMWRVCYVYGRVNRYTLL